MKTDTTTEVLMAGKYPLNVLSHRAAKHDFAKWHHDLVAAMICEFSDGRVVYDIGAEQGEFTALAGKMCGGRNVHIFEPTAMMWPNIRAVWEANVNEPPGGCFVGFAGNETGNECIISLHGWPAAATGNLADESRFGHYIQHPDRPRITIDEYVSKYARPPQVVLIDTEGCEHRVLQGMNGTLGAHKPIILLSLHSEAQLADYGSKREDVFALFSHHGYRSLKVGCEGEEHWLFIP